MQKVTLLLSLLLIAYSAYGQQDVKVNLPNVTGKGSKLAFNIVEVKDARANKEEIGITKVKKKSYRMIFSYDSEKMIKSFIDKQFKANKDGVAIRFQIENLGITAADRKDKKSRDRFFLKTTFYGLYEGKEELLYTFSGSNDMNGTKSPRTDVANYLARALKLSIENFEKAFKKHPEWNSTPSNPIGINVSKEVVYNKIQLIDTIPCNIDYKLSPDNYITPPLEGEVDFAHSAFTMSYSLMAEEIDRKMNLKVYPKVYFLKSKSWAKKEFADSLWLGHQQMLFDITAAYGMKFKQTIEEKSFSPGFYKSEMNALYNSVYRAYNAYIDEFQEATEFGQNAEQAKLWRVKIDELTAAVR